MFDVIIFIIVSWEKIIILEIQGPRNTLNMPPIKQHFSIIIICKGTL